MQIFNMLDLPDKETKSSSHITLDEAVDYYHKAWGNGKNRTFFYDAVVNSSNKKEGLPRFYILVKENKIIGCCGLIVNDFISRHDLLPWLCGVFVTKEERGRQYASRLMDHAVMEAGNAGYSKVYLTTDHDGFYEKYGWTRIEDGYELSGETTRIYVKEC
jgi:N-acetylglutamate synthase-like GNAT family acetyltransferase